MFRWIGWLGEINESEKAFSCLIAGNYKIKAKNRKRGIKLWR